MSITPTSAIGRTEQFRVLGKARPDQQAAVGAPGDPDPLGPRPPGPGEPAQRTPRSHRTRAACSPVGRRRARPSRTRPRRATTPPRATRRAPSRPAIRP